MEGGAISIAGISSDHTDAATITPEAKPNSDFCNRTDISPRIKNTKAEPSIVPSNGIRRPIINVAISCNYLGCKDTKNYFSKPIEETKMRYPFIPITVAYDGFFL